MAPTTSNPWTTDPEHIDLLNFLIERTKNVESPINMKQSVRDFKEKSGTAQTVNCLKNRILRMRTRIHSFEHIDTKTKVKLLFALSASVNADFLEELKKDAFVEVDEKKRITHYQATDGSLELNGDHSSSAKQRALSFESKQCIRSLVFDYFENKNNSNAVPKNEEEKEMGNLIEFITEKCHNANSPLSIRQLVEDFQNRYEISQSLDNIRFRIGKYCREIHRIEFLDTHTKVKQLFCLSTTMDLEYLEELQENAQVEVDENNRITYYKANDGSLELSGDHSLSVKTTTGKLESKGSIQSSVIDCFNEETTADAVSINEVEKEMKNLIDFITEKCENVHSPLSTTRLAEDFNEQFGTSIPSATIRTRIKSYCSEIQNVEFMDTPSKVKQLFGLSATLASNYLTELRKDAVVEVDELNRITKYTANNGILTLHGDHSQSAKQRTAQLAAKRSNRSLIINHFEKKKDAVPENDEEKEMGNFIEFIAEKCESVSSPLSIGQLTKDFNQHFGIARSSNCIFKRVKRYCREIQKTEFMDTHSKVRQLFGLSAKLDSDFLKKLRKDADVEVDELNRITKYTANNGSLSRPLQDHDLVHERTHGLGAIQHRRIHFPPEKRLYPRPQCRGHPMGVHDLMCQRNNLLCTGCLFHSFYTAKAASSHSKCKQTRQLRGIGKRSKRAPTRRRQNRRQRHSNNIAFLCPLSFPRTLSPFSNVLSIVPNYSLASLITFPFPPS